MNDALTDPAARRSKAIDFHNQGVEIVQSGGDKQMAYRLMCSGVAVDPTMAVGWFGLGNAVADMLMFSAAIACFRRCLELPDDDQPGSITPEVRAKAMVQLSHRLLNNGEISEAYEVARDSLLFLQRRPELDKTNRAFAYCNMSLILSIMGSTEMSLSYAREAYDINPQGADIETGLGFALLFHGKYAEGLKHFEARFEYKIPHYLLYPYPRWKAGMRVGTLFIAADQGLGDSVCMTRFIPEVSTMVDRVLYQVQPEIVRMMTIALRHWSNVTVIPQTASLPEADAWCPVFSLPVALGLTTEQIRDAPQKWVVPKDPWCKPPPLDRWKAPGRRLHIGIAYAGSPDNDIDRWRSVPLVNFLALNRVPGVHLYSLQVGPRAQDLHLIGAATLITDMSPWIRDVMDTAAIIRELDLVISIESFVAHLCGAIGKECWIPLSYNGGDWRCGRAGERQLWYPKTRLFRQGADAQWGLVFDKIVQALTERLDG